MTTRIATVTETIIPNEDLSWLKSLHEDNDHVSITLDSATLAAAFPAPSGSNLVFIKSGIVLGKITSTGKYGPYDTTASDGRQTPANTLILARSVQLNMYAGIGGLVDTPAAGKWKGGVVGANLPVQSAGPGYLDSSVKSALPNIKVF